MKLKFLKKYFSIVFVIATFIGVSHHHNDFKTHSNCQICTIQSNLINVDTPVDIIYLSQIDIFSQTIVSILPTPHNYINLITIDARAPPKIS